MSKTIQFADRQVEGWKHLHKEAMECCNVDEMLKYGLSLLDLICRLDEELADDVLQRKAERDTAQEKKLRTLYAAWLKPTANLIERAESFRMKGYEIPLLMAFREACADVRLTVKCCQASAKKSS